MDLITVEIWDATGSKRQAVQAPADAPVNRLIAVLVERLNLPRHSPDGQVMSYKLHHRGSGRQLLDGQTLASAGVKSGDIMRLQPEITAGGGASRGGSGGGVIAPPVVARSEERFSRFERISWWDQQRLRSAKALVIGAGAIGNEVIKNLALLGVGRLFIADMDDVEESNLSRSVLFRARDRGSSKAEAAARAAADIYDGMKVRAWRGNVVHDLGVGIFRWADVIIGGLDNREARVAINRFAARAGRLWVDGAIERLDGVARVFDPASGPCYECTMGENDWRELNARRSCALLTRAELEAGKVPTTPTTASIIAGIQCQEVVKHLHGLPVIAGQGYVFEGRTHQSYLVNYSRDPECAAHDAIDHVVELDHGVADTTALQLLKLGREHAGPDAVIDLGRDMLHGLECLSCGTREPLCASLGRVTEAQGLCPACGDMRSPLIYSTIRGDEPFLDRTLADLGVPPWDVVAARSGDASVGLEFSADQAHILGDLSCWGRS